MGHEQYLLLMAACVVITLPLEFVVGARVYRSPRRLLIAVLPTFVAFTLWDLAGIVRGHWTYDDRYVTGLRLGVIPVEELVFFLVIPLCGVLTFEAVGKIIRLARTRGRLRFRWPDGLVRDRADGYAETGGGRGA